MYERGRGRFGVIRLVGTSSDQGPSVRMNLLTLPTSIAATSTSSIDSTREDVNAE